MNENKYKERTTSKMKISYDQLCCCRPSNGTVVIRNTSKIDLKLIDVLKDVFLVFFADPV